jgi:hypothetical protein
MSNWQEWVCGSEPTNPLSVLRMLSAARAVTNVTVTWQSVAGVNYFLERSVSANPTDSLFAGTNGVLVGMNIPGQAGTTAYTDTNAAKCLPQLRSPGRWHLPGRPRLSQLASLKAGSDSAAKADVKSDSAPS